MTLEEMKRIKKQKGFSNQQLSDYTGVPLGTLQKIMSGATETPRYETRQAIERVLGADERVSYMENPRHKNQDSVVREAAYAYEYKKKQGEYTLEDYYTMPEDWRGELIDGVLYDMDGPTFAHQIIAGNIYAQLLSQINGRKGKCMPMVAPVDVRLDCDERTMVQPDVLIICDRSKVEKWGVMGAPEFVLEVLSPTTKWKDCMTKLVKYQNAGVKEYWMVDPYKKQVTVYDFMHEEGPDVYEMKGEIGLSMYGKQIKLDFESINETIGEWCD